jgi:hypothetical protein
VDSLSLLDLEGGSAWMTAHTEAIFFLKDCSSWNFRVNEPTRAHAQNSQEVRLRDITHRGGTIAVDNDRFLARRGFTDSYRVDCVATFPPFLANSGMIRQEA